LTLLLQVGREEARRRVASRTAATAGPVDRFEQEKEAFFLRVESAYEQIAREESSRVRRIPAEGEPEAVSARIWRSRGGNLPQRD
jgi:dTMP kinase